MTTLDRDADDDDVEVTSADRPAVEAAAEEDSEAEGGEAAEAEAEAAASAGEDLEAEASSADDDEKEGEEEADKPKPAKKAKRDLAEISRELIAAARVRRRPGTSDREFCERVHEKIQDISDEAWNALSEPAKVFHNANIKAMDELVDAKKAGAGADVLATAAKRFTLLDLPSEVEGKSAEEGTGKGPRETRGKKEKGTSMKKTAAKKKAPTKVAAAKKAATSARRKTGEVRETRGRTGSFPLTAKIKLLMKDNPKREGTSSYERYSQYRSGMKVQEALEAGVTWADLKWDSSHNFIEIAA